MKRVFDKLHNRFSTMSVVSLSIGAVVWQHIANTNVRTYAIDRTFCTDMQSRIHNHFVHPVTCQDIHVIARTAFNTWTDNSPGIAMHEVIHTADVTLHASALTEKRLGLAVQTGHQRYEIHLNKHVCWYTESSICARVKEMRFVLMAVMGNVWGGAVIGSVIAIYHRLGILERVAWALIVACPVLHIVLFTPCYNCFDIAQVMIHEVGHVLGFGHVENGATRQLCECGSAVHNCTSTYHMDSVMTSNIQSRHVPCLSRHDTHGLRHVYGGDCDADVMCYYRPMWNWWISCVLLLVLSIALAHVFVTLRTRTCCRTRARIVDSSMVVWDRRGSS